MAKPLPKRFDPDQMARDGARHETSMSLSAFERLATLLQGTDGEVRITSGFTRRKDHIVIGGRLSTTFALQCQRCLTPMTLDIDEPYELTFVPDEQAAEALPASLDPVVLDETGYIETRALFEDELILHVPLIARHADIADCAPLPANVAVGLPAEGDDGEQVRRNPFDALRHLDLH